MIVVVVIICELNLILQYVVYYKVFNVIFFNKT